MQPEAVIFDIGNVLTRWQPEAFYDRVIGRGPPQRLFAEVDLHGHERAVDDGALVPRDDLRLGRPAPRLGPGNPPVVRPLDRMLSPRIEGSIALSARAAGQGRAGLLPDQLRQLFL